MVSTTLKNMSQLGGLFPMYGKIKFMFQSPPTRIHQNTTKTGLQTFFQGPPMYFVPRFRSHHLRPQSVCGAVRAPGKRFRGLGAPGRIQGSGGVWWWVSNDYNDFNVNIHSIIMMFKSWIIIIIIYSFNVIILGIIFSNIHSI